MYDWMMRRRMVEKRRWRNDARWSVWTVRERERRSRRQMVWNVASMVHSLAVLNNLEVTMLGMLMCFLQSHSCLY